MAERERLLQKLKVRQERKSACMAAFEDSAGRSIPTEAISEGIIWKLVDAVADHQRQLCEYECAKLERDDHWEECDDLRALLASLKIQEPDNGR